MMCQISNFRRVWRGAAARTASGAHRMACRPAAAQKNKNDRMEINHAVIRYSAIIGQELSIFDFTGAPRLYKRRAFFDDSKIHNKNPDIAIPPLGRHIWIERRRFYISKPSI